MEFRAPLLLDINKSAGKKQSNILFENFPPKSVPTKNHLGKNSNIFSKLDTKEIFCYKGCDHENSKEELTEKSPYRFLLDTTPSDRKRIQRHSHNMGPLWCTNMCCSPTDKMLGKFNYIKFITYAGTSV